MKPTSRNPTRPFLLPIQLLLTALLTATLTSGCGQKIVPMPVETVHTEYVQTDTAALMQRFTMLLQSGFERITHRDSVSERIKETVVLTANGDTARHDTDRSIYHGCDTQTQQNLLIARFDSLESVLRTLKATQTADSIPVPYPVERQPTQWEQIRMTAGDITLCTLAVAICITAALLIAKHKKQQWK